MMLVSTAGASVVVGSYFGSNNFLIPISFLITTLILLASSWKNRVLAPCERVTIPVIFSMSVFGMLGTLLCSQPFLYWTALGSSISAFLFVLFFTHRYSG